jgi:dynein heavy chain, axonemal
MEGNVSQDYTSNPNFKPDYIRSKSGAAAGLCGWVVNICKYFRIYQVVAPKRAMLAEANLKLAGAEKKLITIRAKVVDLKAKVAALEENLMKATLDKNNAIAQASHLLPTRSLPALLSLEGSQRIACAALPAGVAQSSD